ncbi:hypothetical protein LTR36_003500 [Oleoguttula mirabilis]|uniref:Uncharacterized protein n=1 Tax=Oleoguttula mirabilis TaxID=1507867 RepID=A0AAV9JJ81_9PEZI|nr:hypothetical protein LTR36_003500 [Oleoguttula mirabilis]
MSSFTLRSIALRQTGLRSAISARSVQGKSATEVLMSKHANKSIAFQARSYAAKPSDGPTTPSPSAGPESQAVNSSRGAEHAGRTSGSPDTASLQTPVSNPEQSGLGAQEEEQPSSENMKSDPSEPDHVKRSKVEKEGQKPLDAADK